MSENTISKSKQKRLEMEKARKQQHRNKTIATLMSVLIPIGILGIIVAGVLYYKSTQVDFEKYLANDGTIANINIEDYVQTSYQNITVNKADIMPSDEMIEADIASLCNSYATLSTDSSLVSASGDKVNVYYEATISGVSYNSATPEEGGADFIIGNASVSEDFDEALTGKHPGDTFTTEVSYAADYADAALAGQTVVYNVSFNGIYVAPEFNDVFVQTNLAGQAATAEEYRNSLIEDYYNNNLRNSVTEQISANTVVLQVPDFYVENMEQILLDQNAEQFEYYRQMYSSYGMILNSVYEMYGLSSEEEYLAQVHNMAVENVTDFISIQAIYTASGMTNTEEEVKTYFLQNGYDETTYNEYVSQYGYKYLAQIALQERVIEYLMDTVTVVE